MNKIKSWLEKWQHRLQGDMLITYKVDDDTESHFWVKSVYTDGESILVDYSEDDDPLEIGTKSIQVDITITGA